MAIALRSNKYAFKSLNVLEHTGVIESVFSHAVPSTIYAAPLAIGIGDGSSAANACMLESAIQGNNIIAGDTILLLNGTYKALYSVTVSGTALLNVNIRALNCYQAIIDGGVIIGDFSGVRGMYVDFRGIRVYNSDLNRGTWTTPQGTISRTTSMVLAAEHCNIINNILHDGGVGLTAYNYANNSLIYGNIIFNSGWADDTLGGAQNLYIHSLNKNVKHNIFAGAFKKSVAVYTTHENIENITLEENVIFERTGVLCGGAHGEVISANLISNHIIQYGIQAGYTFTPNELITITNNIVYGSNPLTISYFKNLALSGNKFIGQDASGNGCFEINYTIEKILYNINNNQYHFLGTGLTPFHEGGVNYTFAQWQALGYDAAGSYDTLAPAVNEVYVYPNDYAATDCRKGFIVIWNWEGLNTVNVDLSTLGLVNGNTYRWRQAQDPLVDIDTFVYGGINVDFDMTGHTVAYPIGFTELLIPNQFPTFGCFIIESV